ncbi:hypothetical protein CKAH01_13573 [Colletotrichum kahawae]|uniref:Uncharacterized protein n=1 Tax=Colletotrichum kahawae TaxID=34407 RepID=A0AAD9YSF0_COLKA|nr:hypothetical protein CKAH01_13573 [Colletotrichum kahawae]
MHASVSILADRDGDINLRPHLLTHLVSAFEKVVSRFAIAAMELSLINRIKLQTNGNNYERNLDIIQSRAATTEQEIFDHLQHAKRDIIILGTTRHDIDRHIIAPVGPEFLIISLLRNIQNHTILQGRRQKIEAIKYYRHSTSRIRFESIRDPKRRRFLQISRLEEELEALRMIVQTQQRLIKTYWKALHPRSFQRATTEKSFLRSRKTMFSFEEKLILLQEQKLDDDDYFSFEELQSVTRALRSSMSQSIEIVEEDHGRAVRVFTIVTLFFLPL